MDNSKFNSANIGQTVAGQSPVYQANQNISGDYNSAVKASGGSLPIIVGLVISTLVAVTFVGLFIWIWGQWSDLSKDFEAKVDAEVAVAVSDNTEKLQAEFDEERKNPYDTFTGPVDYGALSFSYPKTWSVYEVKDGAAGEDFEAYLNPERVSAVEPIYALRVSILNKTYDTVVGEFQERVQKGELALITTQVNGQTANRYEGRIDENRVGIFTVVKIRDKTAIIQTDAETFRADYDALLGTVTFNL
ncbi:MAG: hypothetical protein Q4F60_01745 [Candidatus Saccharibacteria bacterium]|nr:hypothetical protein [Candidatus Saccharibacteria bacterium]